MRKATLVLAAALSFTGYSAFAEEPSTTEKAAATVKEAASDTGKGAKKLGRNIKDKTCEMVNGKMECAAKKVKHGVQNVGDEVHDATH